MRRIYCLLLIFTLMRLCSAQEVQDPDEDSSRIKIGNFAEYSKDPIFQYNMIYTAIEAEGFSAQYEIFDSPASYQRIWINPHQFTLIESEDFICKVSPGFGISNDATGKTDIFYGADAEYDLPAARIRILQRSYKGNHFDQHYFFSIWQPFKEEDQFLLMHFMNINSDYPSTSFVGPAANVLDGHLFFWVGTSLTRNATWATNLQATIQF